MASSPGQQVIKRFQRALRHAQAKMGLPELASRAGLDPQQVAMALDAAAQPDLDTQAALAKAAGYEYEEFLFLGRRLAEQDPASPVLKTPRQGAGPAGLLLHLAGAFRLAEGEEESLQPGDHGFGAKAGLSARPLPAQGRLLPAALLALLAQR